MEKLIFYNSFTSRGKAANISRRYLDRNHGGVKLMQKILFSLAAILLCISMASAQEPPQEVMMAAQTGLPQFLGLIPPAERSAYGFTENDDLTKAFLEAPFNLHTIKPPALLAYQSGDSVPALLSKTDMWYFPVMMGEEVRAVLVVDQLDGKWQAVSLGYATLAQQLQGVLQQWPGSKGFHPLLIAVFQAKEHLILVPEANANNLISLRPQAPGLKMDSAGDVLERLKPIVAESLKQKF
jgi:hypothetical protein